MICGWLFPIKSKLFREVMAEFLGTFVLMIFGLSCVAQYVLSEKTTGNFFAVNWGWGIAVMLAVLVAGGVSGAHINPAVTLALAMVNPCDASGWLKLPFYILAQFLGSFAASALTYAVYYEALNSFDGGVRHVTGIYGTAGIWVTFPQDYLTVWGGLLDQIVGTAILLLCICAITDKRNMNVPPALVALFIGLTVTAIGISFGYNFGYAINPARDFPPRVFLLMAGWGSDVFSSRHWWWIPIVGPLIGGIVGSVLYRLLVELHWEESGHSKSQDNSLDGHMYWKDLKDIPYIDEEA